MLIKLTFFKVAPNELKLAVIALSLGATMQYEKDTATGLEKVSMLIPNGKDNGFTPCVFTLGINDCIGNSAFNAICKNIGVYDYIFSNDLDEQKINKLANQFNQKFKLKKGNNYVQSFLQGKVYEFGTKYENSNPGPELNKMYMNIAENILSSFNKMYAVDNAKNQTIAQQGK